MNVNIWAVIAATVVMFLVGAIWYSVPFQKAWAKIHGFDKLSKEQQDEMMKGMGPIYGAQLFVTILSSFALTYAIILLPEVSFYQIVFFVWLGFVMPSQVSAVLFSRTDDSMKFQQIAIMSGEALIRLMLAGWAITLIIGWLYASPSY